VFGNIIFQFGEHFLAFAVALEPRLAPVVVAKISHNFLNNK
jgi:hypothetical protein